jgi:alkylation response protein AidB-like acyl-CoA dehydrogenase
MMNHHMTELFFDEVPVPKSALIVTLDNGFRYVLDGMNAERILIAYACTGDAKFFIDRAVATAAIGMDSDGFAREYDIERKLRETRLYQVAPVSTNLILSYIGEHVLGMPRSF